MMLYLRKILPIFFAEPDARLHLDNQRVNAQRAVCQVVFLLKTADAPPPVYYGENCTPVPEETDTGSPEL